jgi:hypothetical protein
MPAPHPDDVADLKTARAVAYDLVLNGYEIGGGSLRIYQPDVQQRVFDTIGLTWSQTLGLLGASSASIASRMTADTVVFRCFASRTTLAADATGSRTDTSSVRLFV